MKWSKYKHAKNGLKTVLGRSGAEIIDFLCFNQIRHLQHDTRIESCRIVCHKYENYDMSYRVGRIANSFHDTKRLSYTYVVYCRILSYLFDIFYTSSAMRKYFCTRNFVKPMFWTFSLLEPLIRYKTGVPY